MSDEGEIKTEFRHDLGSKFTYSSKGSLVEATFIILSAPSTKYSKECSALKQAFFRALPPGDAEVEPDAKDPTGMEVMILLAISTKVELPEVIEIGKKLLSSGLAQVDGEAKLTMHLIELMRADEFDEMLGEYIVNFIIASSLAKMKSK
jgi:hypothetical protein